MAQRMIRSSCSIFVAAALVLAAPVYAQAPATPSEAQDRAQVEGVITTVSDTIPQGLDIPAAEAEQIRGGNIRLALVAVQVGKRLVYKVIACTSSSSCRNAAIKKFGREAVKQVFWASGIAGAQKLACKAGIRQFC